MGAEQNASEDEKIQPLNARQQGSASPAPSSNRKQKTAVTSQCPSDTSSSSSSQVDLSAEEQCDGEACERDVENLEALAVVPSGPLYSVFSRWQKRWIVFMVTVAAFISPTSSNIYFPALNALSADLHVSSTVINTTITAYMIFQGLAPTIFGDLGDMLGRRPAFILSFTILIGANIGLALQNNFAALFVLRCMQASGSSGAIALSMGVVADISTSAERGSYMGIVGAGTMLGPCLGPVIGGILAQFIGWRSIFWFLTIFVGAYMIPYVLTVPETGRNIVGNGSIPPQPLNMNLLDYLRLRKERKSNGLSRTSTLESRRAASVEMANKRNFRLPNPLNTLHIIMEKDVAVILAYNALIYTAFYCVMGSLPNLFFEIYGFDDLLIGLCYIPFGVGCAIAAWFNGRMLDHNYRRVAKQVNFTIDRKHGDNLRNFPIEQARIGIIYPILLVGLAAILCYGWVLQQNANLAWPLILTFIIGLCVNGSFNILSTLLVDLYPQRPATATAANNLVRCFLGAGGTGIINIMINGMGRGWCFTFISLVCFVTMPMLWAVTKWGPGWREERHMRMDKSAEEKKAKEAATHPHETDKGSEKTQKEPEPEPTENPPEMDEISEKTETGMDPEPDSEHKNGSS